uniref:Trichome birefringence-like N-terminal domain-containing protein n=1 Tax=Kalanchoe fedtschenkoi TaxID=63787 RepID=A0A7N0U1K7_KALFE
MKKLKEQQHQASPLQILTRRILPITLCAILPIAIFRMYFSHLAEPQSPKFHQPQIINPNVKRVDETRTCNYTEGKWVQSRLDPLYNGTSCGTIRDAQNCQTHGRTDVGYLYWRWKPNGCHLPRFDPNLFLRLMRNKHLAFVGDSLARNQLESLLCMLATVSSPQLVYTDGVETKFRRWYLVSHNVTLSSYWSPFLVMGVEKSNTGLDHNELFLDSVNERWAKDLWEMDVIVLSIGHWFLNPAVYYDGDSVLGCHYCHGMNHTEIGFYEVYRKVVRTALRCVVDRRGGDESRRIDIFLTTFTPAHFEGEWDDPGACSKTRPYKTGEKAFEGMNAEMRRVGVEEVEAAQEVVKQSGGVRLEALDVTKLAFLRPDGHPGPYLNPFPFADGRHKDRVQNDCVHWCLPGPIDTWNEILLDVMKRREQNALHIN